MAMWLLLILTLLAPALMPEQAAAILYTQSTCPATARAGDECQKTGDGKKYRHNGTSWVETLANQSPGNVSITGGNIGPVTIAGELSGPGPLNVPLKSSTLANLPTTCTDGIIYRLTDDQQNLVQCKDNQWKPLRAVKASDFGASASPQVTTGTTHGSSLTLAAARDFRNTQGIAIHHGGAVPALATPAAPTLSVLGTTGSTTYTVCLAAATTKGGGSACGATAQVTTGPASLGKGQLLNLTWSAIQQDYLVDADGSTTTGSGTPDTIAAGAALRQVAASDHLCTDQRYRLRNILYPSNVYVDSDGDCDPGTGTQTVLVGAASGSMAVGSTWAYKDSNANNAYDDGEDLYIDYAPTSAYTAVSADGYLYYRNGALAAPIPNELPYCDELGTCTYRDGGESWAQDDSLQGDYSLIKTLPWPATPPGAAFRETHVTSILSGGGTTTLTLVDAPIQDVTNEKVLHDDTAALNAATMQSVTRDACPQGYPGSGCSGTHYALLLEGGGHYRITSPLINGHFISILAEGRATMDAQNGLLSIMDAWQWAQSAWDFHRLNFQRYNLVYDYRQKTVQQNFAAAIKCYSCQFIKGNYIVLNELDGDVTFSFIGGRSEFTKLAYGKADPIQFTDFVCTTDNNPGWFGGHLQVQIAYLTGFHCSPTSDGLVNSNQSWFQPYREGTGWFGLVTCSGCRLGGENGGVPVAIVDGANRVMQLRGTIVVNNEADAAFQMRNGGIILSDELTGSVQQANAFLERTSIDPISWDKLINAGRAALFDAATFGAALSTSWYKFYDPEELSSGSLSSQLKTLANLYKGREVRQLPGPNLTTSGIDDITNSGGNVMLTATSGDGADGLNRQTIALSSGTSGTVWLTKASDITSLSAGWYTVGFWYRCTGCRDFSILVGTGDLSPRSGLLEETGGAWVWKEFTFYTSGSGYRLRGYGLLNGGSATLEFSTPFTLRVGIAPGRHVSNDLLPLADSTRAYTGTAAPVGGSWKPGDFAIKTDPTSGSILLWRCVGTAPCTWEAVYAPPGAGTANQLTGMNAGATAMEWKSLVGTASQITVTHAAGSVTFSLPATINVNVNGNAAALAANGSNCSAGNAPLGVDASGAVEGCYPVVIPPAAILPTSTGTGSTLAHAGTVHRTTASTDGGILFVTSYTLDAGITNTCPALSGGLTIFASVSITINGTIACQSAGTAARAGGTGAGGSGGSASDQPGGGGGGSSTNAGGAGGFTFPGGQVWPLTATPGTTNAGPGGTSGGGTGGTPTQVTGANAMLYFSAPSLRHGGANGGAGGGDGSSNGGNGGIGGGSIVLIAPTITLGASSVLNTSGGAGGNAAGGNAGGGGGGGAGDIMIYTHSFTDNGATYTQSGGAGGTKAGSGGNGGVGAVGTKQIVIQ